VAFRERRNSKEVMCRLIIISNISREFFISKQLRGRDAWVLGQQLSMTHQHEMVVPKI